MLGYIKVPEWISLDIIDSDRFINFISNAEYQDDDKISLNYLRRYFENNRSIGLDIIDELSLRGFEFHYEGSSKFLPDHRYSDSEEIILANGSFRKFRDMNFNLIGLGDLIRRFNVKSDNFFNYIPISGFKALTQNSKYSLIKSEFMKSEFLVLPRSDIGLDTNRLDIYNNNRRVDRDNDVYQLHMDDCDKVDFDIDALKKEYGSILQGMKISEVFSEGILKFVLRYCYRNRISRLIDLSNKDIARIPMERGVGQKRYEELIKKLNEIKMDIEIRNKRNGDKELDDIRYMKIEDVFLERKYQMFRDFCEEKQIVYLSLINGELIEEYSKIKGVGQGKIEDVKVRLEEINYSICYIEDIVNDEYIYDIDRMKIGIENYLEEMKIDIIFHNRSFKIIRDYCYENGIVTLCDLTNKDVTSISKLRSIGKKKFSDFIDLLNNSVNEAKNQKELFSNSKFYLEQNVYDKYKDMELSQLFELLSLEATDCKLSIRDVQGKKLSEIDDMKLLKNLNILSTKLSSTKDIDEIVTIAYKELNPSEAITIIARYYDKMTLQETGEILELTRERARQIETNALKKMFNVLRANNFKDSIKLTFGNNRSFSIESLIKYLRNENLFFIDIIKSDGIKYLNYFKPLNIVYFDNFINEIKIIQDQLDEISDYGLIEDYLDIMENIVSDVMSFDMEFFNINEFLESFDFKIYGKYYSKQKLSLTRILEMIFKYHIKEPMRVDEEELQIINKLTKSIFNIDYIWTDRNADSKLRHLEDIILTDRKTFCHIDHLKNNIFLMNQVKNFIDNYLENNGFINIELVFDNFEESCIENGICNKLHLYSMIKYNFGDDYNTNYGNTLTITSKDNETRITNEERLEEFLFMNNEKVSKKQITEHFHWTRSKIENVISSSNKLFTFETEMVANIDRIFIDDEINEFDVIVKGALKDGFSTAHIIFNQMLFNEKLYRVLNRNNIKQSSTIANLVRKIYGDIFGHTNFLYRKGSDYQSIYDVIRSQFQEKTNRKEIGDYLLSLGYKTPTVGVYINNIIDNRIYREIAIDELVDMEKFIISVEVVNTLKEEIYSRMGEREYISLNLLRNYRRNLPNIDFRWNPYLIRSILEGNGFKRIIRRNSDYRNESVIILKEESNINYFDELVYYLLKNDYDGNLHETPVYEYLSSLGLLRFQENKQNMKLPYEIVNSDLFNIDNTGRITLKEVKDKIDDNTN